MRIAAVAGFLLFLVTSSRSQGNECVVAEVKPVLEAANPVSEGGQRRDSSRCSAKVLAQLDGSSSTFWPGLFDPSAEQGSSGAVDGPECGDPFDVPQGSKAPYFLGSATAAYQVEGAAAEGGRAPSIWDTFSHTPGKTDRGDSGDVACDFYRRFPEDVALMRSLGLRHFRFSLSWTRLFPTGVTQGPNPEGVRFYSELVDALREACIEPWITLYHWDLPQALQEGYGGWTSPRIVEDFTAFAEAAFKLFGDRVRYWFTLNEPETFCALGFESGIHAPGRCSDRGRCAEGDSEVEPHLCAYHAILAHASAVRSFRRLVPGGKIGMTNAIGWSEPFTPSKADAAAAERQQAFQGGQFLDPLYRGDWTEERKAVLGDRLPAFTSEQRSLLLDNQQDFVALQHYTGSWTYDDPARPPLNASSTVVGADGVPLPQADSPWLFVFPHALRSLLGWLQRRYGAPIYITENGVSAPGESGRPAAEVLCDSFRLSYYQQYVGNATEAKQRDGVDLHGYFAWSLLDNFEWADGYSKRFGINFVDYATQQRFTKASALWLSRWFGLEGAL